MAKKKRRKAAKNVRIKNLVYDMMENRQSDRAIEIDLLHRKEKAIGYFEKKHDFFFYLVHK